MPLLIDEVQAEMRPPPAPETGPEADQAEDQTALAIIYWQMKQARKLKKRKKRIAAD